MSPTHFHVKSLAGKIFSSVLVFAFAIVLVFGVAMTSIYYYSYEREGEAKLSALAHEAADYLNATPSSENVPALQEQFAGLVRYTLIAEDGEVLFDSAADESTMENHGLRPEVAQAEAEGSSAVARYSETLKTDTIYAAVKLDDGSIVRLSETRESLFSFLGSMLVPILVALAVVAVLVFLLSKTLTRRIMKPIDALNFADPLENEIYEEMDPLLERIDEQQKLLKQQNKELALAENMRRDFSSNVSHDENALAGDIGLRGAHEERHGATGRPSEVRGAHLRGSAGHALAHQRRPDAFALGRDGVRPRDGRVG